MVITCCFELAKLRGLGLFFYMVSMIAYGFVVLLSSIRATLMFYLCLYSHTFYTMFYLLDISFGCSFVAFISLFYYSCFRDTFLAW